MSRRFKGNLPGNTGSLASSNSMASPDDNLSSLDVQPHPRWLSFAVCLFLALAVWAVFGQTRHFDFVNYDDNIYVYENPAITQGLGWHQIIGTFTLDNGLGEWFPLTDISHILAWEFYGPNAGGHHLINVLLHAATAMLLFLVLRNMTGTLWRSAFVAAVFAIHPLRVESVAWVAERKDVLSGLFFMLTLWAYVRYAQRQLRTESRETSAGYAILALDPRRQTLDYVLALFFFTLGLLSKTMLVTLPLVLLLLDYWPLHRFEPSTPRRAEEERRRLNPQLSTFNHLLFEKLPFFALSAASCVITVLTQKHVFTTIQGLTFRWRVGNALLAYTDYLGHMIYPAGLALIYPHPERHLLVLKVGLSLLVLFLISAGVLAGRRRHPYLLVGWLWYLVMLLPVIDIMQTGDQTRADRYTYLPQIGLYMLVAWAAVKFCGTRRHRKAMLGTAAGAVLAVLLAVAYVQTGYWQDSVSLWTHSLACTSGNYIANNNLGIALADQGKWPEAIEHYEQALQFSPIYADAHYNLGIALAGQGRLPEAIEHYERALQLKPDYAAAHCNLGIALAAEGKLAEAIEHYEQALQIKPNSFEAHNNFGIALARQGKLTEAIEHFEQTLQLKPDNADAHYNLGIALASQRNSAAAIPHFQQALTLATVQGNTILAASIRARLNAEQPASPEALNNLGAALAARGRLEEAIENYRRAIDLNPNLPEIHLHLGAVLGQTGRAREAAAQYQEALRLNPDLAGALNNLAWILATSPDDELRNGTEAVRRAERACELTHYQKPLFIGTLAAAYAETGRFPEAVATAGKAEQLATEAGLTALAGKNRELLGLYQAGKPYHEPGPPKP